jgi:WD40 repeat protein
MLKLRLLVFILFLNLFAYSQKIGFELQSGHTVAIGKLLLSHNNELLFSTGQNENSIFIWQTASGKKVKTLYAQGSPITDLYLDKKTNELLSIDGSGFVRVWDYIKGVQNKTFRLTGVNSFESLIENGTKETKSIKEKIFSIDSLNKIANVTTVPSIAGQYNSFQNKNSTLVVGDTTFMIYDLGVIRIAGVKGSKSKSSLLFDQSLLKKYTNIILLDKTKKQFIITTNKGDVIISTFNGNKVKAFKFGNKSISSVCLSENKKTLVVGNELGEISILDLINGEIISQCRGINIPIERIYYSPDGNTLYLIRGNEIISFNYSNNSSKRLNTKIHLDFASIDSISGDSVVVISYLKGQSRYAAKWNTQKNTFTTKETVFAGSSGYTFGDYKIAIAQSSDGFGDVSVSFSGEGLVIKEKDKDPLYILTGYSSEITAIKINKVYKYITTSFKDGRVAHWDLYTGKSLFTSLVVNTNTYIHLISNGYYYGTKQIFNSLNCTKGVKILPNFQMDEQYNRPDLVIKKIPQHDTVLAMAIEHSYAKRKNKIVPQSDSLSELILNATKTNSELGKLSLQINIQSSNSIISQFHLFVNGVDENITIDTTKKALQLSTIIELANGENKIEVFAQDKLGNFSNKIVFSEKYKTKIKPNLYLVCIGSSKFIDKEKNLNYADKDASDAFKLFSKSKIYKKIYARLYLNENVNASIISEIQQMLSSAQKNDVVIVFYAGHGILNKDLDYFLSTYSVDFNKPEKEGIAYEKLEGLLQNCLARKKLFFIDACHSGDIEKQNATQVVTNNKADEGIKFRSGTTTSTLSQNELSLLLSKELFASGSNSSGTSIIGASMGSQYALESNQWNNGVFTHSLILGLNKGKADYNHDDKIMLDELQYYVNKNVEELTGGKQKPTTRKENLIGNIRLK